VNVIWMYFDSAHHARPTVEAVCSMSAPFDHKTRKIEWLLSIVSTVMTMCNAESERDWQPHLIRISIVGWFAFISPVGEVHITLLDVTLVLLSQYADWSIVGSEMNFGR
jgi:hypothetical protein